jgi:molecular chaperone HtpG
LILTLAVYFHDLGMVVKREEYERRHESSFPEFKKTVFDGDQGKDYHEKVAKMPEGEAERFLYQEFVRQHHPERIRQWISGKSKGYLGIADRVISEVDQLLKGLHDRFRKDLGLICESHHLDDLDDLAN